MFTNNCSLRRGPRDLLSSAHNRLSLADHRLTPAQSHCCHQSCTGGDLHNSSDDVDNGEKDDYCDDDDDDEK